MLPPGEITLTLRDEDAVVSIVVEDNGKGLPNEGRERLTEPYMTTRSKGTGLGLAIVKKIMEDHGGYLGARRPRGWRCAHQSGIPARREGNRVGSTTCDSRTMIRRSARGQFEEPWATIFSSSTTNATSAR